MALQVVGIIFDELTSDPGTPAEGQVWYNTTENRLKVYRNGSTETLVDKDELDAHTTSTSNPHQVTLEQARTQNNTVAGNIAMGDNKVTGLGTPTADGDAATLAWTNDQITQRLQGLSWQSPVIDKDLTAPPGSPSTGDRYIVASPATGAWSTHEDDIAEWDGAAWEFTTPLEGYTCRVMDENNNYQYSGSAWELWEQTTDHGSLLGLSDDDHTQYLLASGARAMAGSLDMGTNAITNVGNVDGRDVSADGTKLDGIEPGAKDDQDITAGAGMTGGGVGDVTLNVIANADGSITVNANDIQVGVLASDAQHGTRGGGTQHSLSSSSGHGFMPQSNLSSSANPTVNDDGSAGYVVGSRWVNVSTDKEWVCLDNSTGAAVWTETTATAGGGFLVHKAGRVLAASFSGSPKVATVTLSAAFADANYAVTLTARTDGTRSYAPNVTTQAAGSFTIDLGSNGTTGLVHVAWIAVKDGESS